MTIPEEEIKERLFGILERRGPTGWYVLEQSLPVDPAGYPDGKNMMTYLRTFCDEGLLSGSEDTKFQITDLGRKALKGLIQEKQRQEDAFFQLYGACLQSSPQ